MGFLRLNQILERKISPDVAADIVTFSMWIVHKGTQKADFFKSIENI